MAKIDKVPSEGEQSEELTKIMKEMASAFEKIMICLFPQKSTKKNGKILKWKQ